MTTTLEPWFLGNIIFGGLIGSTTDGLSGAVHEYAPNQYYITMVPNDSGTFNENIPEKTKIIEFVVVSYQNILSDLSTGGGEYLSSLINMLKTESDGNDTIIKKIRLLSEVYSDIPIFAERVSELYKS
jgi:RNA processing factor Prp31